MVTDLVRTLLDALKLAPRYVAAIALGTGCLLFAGDQLLEQLGLRELAENHRDVVGLAFVVSASLLVIDFTIQMAGIVKRWWRERGLYRRMEERLQMLTEPEMQILRFYMFEQTRTNMLRLGDGVAEGLVAAGIIARASDVGSLVHGFPYNLHEFAWYYLQVHPDVLSGTTNTYRTDQVGRR